MISSLRFRAFTAQSTVAILALGLLSVIAPVVAPQASSLMSQSRAATTVALTDADALVFNRANGVVNIVGDGKTAGNIVLYKNVGNFGGVAIDAAVTTEAISGSISDYDNPGSASTATGAANNFQLNTVGGQVTMKFEFFKAGTYTAAGTGIPVILQNVKITSIDLDSSSAAGSYQYSDFTGFQKYSMMSPTNLAVSTGVVYGTAGVRFIAAKTGSRSSVPEDQVLVRYDAVQTFRVNFGNLVAGSTNYFGLVFGGWPNGGTPVEYTNLFNAPPVSTDYAVTMSTTAESNTVTTSMFGTYSDPDLNPFTKVQLGAPSSGKMQFFNGSSWVDIAAGTSVLVSDIEAGKVRFDPTGATSPVTVPFYVNDGLLNSVASYTLTITLVANTNQITFNNPGDKAGPTGNVASGATATSTLPVTLTSTTTSVCTVSGLTINWIANGTCSITATEPGNTSYPAALPVTQTFLVYQSTSNTQTITFAQPTGKNTGVTFASGATASSTLPVTLTSNTPSICIVSGLNIITLAAGTCSITATQSGGTATGGVYPPAAPVTQTFLVSTAPVLPVARTLGASNISSSGATLTGEVDPNTVVATKWQFCYKQTSSPSVTNGVLGNSPTCTTLSSALSDATTANQFQSTTLNSLSSGKTYYYQIIANDGATPASYGAVFKFSTSGPYLTTQAPNPLGTTTATLKGSFTSSGGGGSSTYKTSFCYSTSPVIKSYAALSSCVATVTGNPSTISSTGNLDSAVTGLSANTRYYYQAIISRTYKGKTYYTYGNVVPFVTAQLPPVATTLGVTGQTSTSAILNGSVVGNGSATSFEFCLTTSSTASSGVLSACPTTPLVTASPSSVSSSSATAGTYNATGLTLGTTYYYQVVATRGGTPVYGAIKTFTAGAPTVTTLAPTNVAQTVSATTWQGQLNGYMNPNGSPAFPYFCYSLTDAISATTGALSSSPTCITSLPSIMLSSSGAAITDSTTATTAYYSVLTGLTANTRYYYQAYGLNTSLSPNLSHYGEVLSFLTASAPTVTTTAATSVTQTTASINGTLIANGPSTTGYFCLSSSNAATDGILDKCDQLVSSSSNSPTTSGTPVNLTKAITDLTAYTTYYFQAIGDNSQGTVYGSILNFRTAAGAPIPVTLPATSIAATTATINGTVNAGGSSATVKFCYLSGGSTPNTDATTGQITDTCTLVNATPSSVTAADGTKAVLYNITGLTAGNRYYFQVQATNSNGSSYGAVLSFYAGAPSVTTTDASLITATGAQLNGLAKSNGADTTPKFCYSTSPDVSDAGLLLECDAGGTNPTTASPNLIAAATTTEVTETLTVTGLSTATTYYFQIIGTNSRGTNYGAVKIFRTGAPEATTVAASSVSTTSARLNGHVNPNGDGGATSKFCLSDSNSVDDAGVLATCLIEADPAPSGLGGGTSDVVLLYDVTSGLTAGTTYYFQIIATGSNGDAVGEVLEFTTTPLITVIFDKNASGATGTMSNQSASVATLLTSNAYSYSGYTFSGWSDTTTGTVLYGDHVSFPFTADTTLYAIWTAAGSTPAPTPPAPVLPVITWEDPAPKVGPYTLSPTELNAICSVPGSTLTYSPAAGIILAPGTYTLTVTCNPPAGSGYGPTTKTVKFTVTKPTTKITWAKPKSVTGPYRLTVIELNAKCSVDGTITYTPALGKILPVGTYELTAICKPKSPAYDPATANVTLEVLPKGTPLPTPSATPKPTPSPTTPTTPAVIPTPKETLPAVVGKVETIAGPREIAPNQIAPVKQEITLKLSDELVPVRVTVNGKTSGAAINDDGTIELTKLVGPKDKVVVIAQNSETTVQIPVVVKNPLIAIANINFNFASSALTTAAKNILKNVAKVVNDHGFTYINLQGHTDVFAGAGYDNQALSDARSNAAKAYLASLLKNKKVTIVLGGNAAREPVIDSTDSAARAINRRVEILVK